jgi:23S rRNA (uracil1939-C5)-methyltransferase
LALATFDPRSRAHFHCEHAQRCPGCPLIDLDYAEQLEKKRERVRAASARYPRLATLRIDDTLPAEPVVGYRGRAKLIVGWSGDAPTLGLYAADHQVVDIPHCRVLRPLLFDYAARLRQLLRDPPASAGGCLIPESNGGDLSAFDLREVIDTEPGLLVTFVVRPAHRGRGGELSAAASALQALSDRVLGVAVNHREAKSPQLLGARTETLLGTSLVRDRAGTAHQVVTFGSFAQAHRAQAEKILDMIAARLDRLGLARDLRLLDLYGGTGAALLAYAQRGARVTLIESFAPAADGARRAAEDLGLGEVSIRTGDAGGELRTLANEGARFDAVIANPPRRGMTPAVRKALAKIAPRAIAYVSCDPDTLARDLAHLATLGYRAEAIQPIDMIPLTDQVECVAILLSGDRLPVRVLYEDDHLRILEKPAHAAAEGEDRLLWASPEQASGISVWSKKTETFAAFRAALGSSRQVHVALARGTSHKRGKIGKCARYERLTPPGGHSLLKVTAEQAPPCSLVLRQLAKIGHPVAGDTRHGHAPTNRHFEEKYALDRLFLHTMRLELDHPLTGATIRVDSALPGDLAMVLERLGYLASMSRNEW